METIWTFEDNEAIETDKVDMKPFKPTGKFFEDIQTLVRLFGIKTHPALRESTYRGMSQTEADQMTADDQSALTNQREILALNFYKYRLDSNSLRATFLCLPAANTIQTLKFSNNGLTCDQMRTLTSYLAEDACPITNLFLDWNPLYENDFKAGDSVPHGTNKLYELKEVPENQELAEGQEEEKQEISLFAKLISEAKKLQVVFFRASGLTDLDLKHICMALKPETELPMNRNLKVLDISYNNFSGKAIRELKSVFEQNRAIEFLGLAKNKLTTEDVVPLISCFGRVPFPSDQVEQYQAEMKKRDAIVEKNKKLKSQKKPEEPVPIMDQLESEPGKDEEGNEITNWFLQRCPQFRHLNLCLNKIDDEILPEIEDVLLRTPDDFGLTLTGNHCSRPTVERIQGKIKELYKRRCAELRAADPNNVVPEVEDIAQRRLAF